MGLVIGVLIGAAALWALTQGGQKKPATIMVYPGEIWTLGFVLPQTMTAADWEDFMLGLEGQANVMGVTQGGVSHYTITLEYLAPVEIAAAGQTIDTPWGPIHVAFAQRAPAGR